MTKDNGKLADTPWRKARRIVVKIGSALLVDRKTGRLKATWLNSLADDAADLVAEGREVILVSSGAIALGRHVMGLPRGTLELEQSQAAAAVGQISLASAYQDVFRARGLGVAQVLLTLGDTEERRRYLNARRTMHPLRALAAGARCTWFLAASDPIAARKRWIAGQLEPAGQIVIDAGAEAALASGKSLLPAGVTRLEGDFDRGDPVVIRSADGRELGRGLVAYARADAERIRGKKSGEIAAVLGFAGRAELVHRDDMVLSRI